MRRKGMKSSRETSVMQLKLIPLNRYSTLIWVLRDSCNIHPTSHEFEVWKYWRSPSIRQEFNQMYPSWIIWRHCRRSSAPVDRGGASSVNLLIFQALVTNKASIPRLRMAAFEQWYTRCGNCKGGVCFSLRHMSCELWAVLISSEGPQMALAPRWTGQHAGPLINPSL